MITITIANQKGGVGKSMSAAMISTELALRNYRVLLIDGDPQANATGMFLDPSIVEQSLADVIVPRKDNRFVQLEEVILTTEVKNLDIAPAHIQLASFDRQPPMSITKLRKVLREVSHIYDFAIIDTPPNLGLLLSAALTAATHVLIPVQASPMVFAGIKDLLDSINQAQEDMNEGLMILGAVCTMLDTRTAISGQAFKALKQAFPDNTFDTIIHRSTKLEEAPVMHQPVQIYAPQSRSAEQYASLTSEILTRLDMDARPTSLRVVTGGS